MARFSVFHVLASTVVVVVDGPVDTLTLAFSLRFPIPPGIDATVTFGCANHVIFTILVASKATHSDQGFGSSSVTHLHGRIRVKGKTGVIRRAGSVGYLGCRDFSVCSWRWSARGFGGCSWHSFSPLDNRLFH